MDRDGFLRWVAATDRGLTDRAHEWTAIPRRCLITVDDAERIGDDVLAQYPDRYKIAGVPDDVRDDPQPHPFDDVLRELLRGERPGFTIGEEQ